MIMLFLGIIIGIIIVKAAYSIEYYFSSKKHKDNDL